MKIIKHTTQLFILLIACYFSYEVAAQTKTTGKNRPNIVFILSDDHSAAFLGCYGNPDLKTPHLDRLANEGIRFTSAYTTAPQCVLSRASIMTGRSVLDIQMSRFTAPLAKDVISYPELLREAGYYTGICGRNFHLNGARTSKESEETFDTYNLETFKNRVNYLRVSANTDTIYNQYTEFLNQVPKDKPFFIQVGYSDPHRVFNATDFEPNPASITVPAGMPDTRLLREDLAGYLGEIQRLDKEIGRVLEELKRRGLDKNTLVVFMGDNGGALLRGKETLYTLGLNIPLIVRYPGITKSAQVSNILVSGEDIAPTFLEAAGVAIPQTITGKSILPALQGKPFKNREYVFAVRGAHGSGLPTNTANFDLGRTIISSKFKLIYQVLWQLPYTPVDFDNQPFWTELKQQHQEGKLEAKFDQLLFAPQRSMFELYDLEADPNEFNNLVGQAAYAETEKKLKSELHKWMILNEDYVPLPVAPYPKKVAVTNIKNP